MTWMQTFDAIFFITIAGLIAALIKYCVEYCLKSKCIEFELCCIKIVRNVDIEAQIETQELQHRTSQPNPSAQMDRLPANVQSL